MTKKQYEDEVERLAPSLRRIAYSIVRNEHDAQDAVQQALLAVWARRECVEFARLKPIFNACSHERLPGHSAGKTKSNPYEGNAGNELSTAGRHAG